MVIKWFMALYIMNNSEAIFSACLVTMTLFYIKHISKENING